jgi:hypothetical protein
MFSSGGQWQSGRQTEVFMSRRMQLAAGILALCLFAALSATAPVASAADSRSTPPAATTQVAGELEQLDEIWIRGKRLAEEIEDAEDAFFAVYNKVNKNHDYDVFCGEMNMNSLRMSIVRTCVPGFILYNYYDLAGRPVTACSATSEAFFGCTAAPLPPPALLAMRHRDPYRENVLRIIGSDERLRTMATRLAGLYGEMEATQKRYVSMKPAVGVRTWKDRKSTRTITGPRVL